jgi:AbrB family looped-hinge helix DNA binding protein
MDDNGRVVIPAEMRAALGMQSGGDLVAELRNGTIRPRPLRDVVAEVQASVRRYVPAGTRLSDELIRDRRLEAERE